MQRTKLYWNVAYSVNILVVVYGHNNQNRRKYFWVLFSNIYKQSWELLLVGWLVLTELTVVVEKTTLALRIYIICVPDRLSGTNVDHTKSCPMMDLQCTVFTHNTQCSRNQWRQPCWWTSWVVENKLMIVLKCHTSMLSLT